MLDRVIGVHISCFALCYAVFRRLKLCNELDVWIVLLLDGAIGSATENLLLFLGYGEFALRGDCCDMDIGL